MATEAKKPVKKEPEVKKVPRKDLFSLRTALSDLGANRLPYRLSERISLWKGKIQVRIDEAMMVKEGIVTPYLPKGAVYKDIKEEHEMKLLIGTRGYREVMEKLNLAFEDQVDIEFSGAPLNLASIGDQFDELRVMDDSDKLLKLYGLVTTPSLD